MLLLTVLSLAPAVLMMTTCFIRIVIVLGLLRQALGTQQLPPTQVITSIALFMTLLIMTPVWKQVYDDAIKPYTDPTVEMSLEDAWTNAITPIRQFMIIQIKDKDNLADIELFYEHLPIDEQEWPEYEEDIPLQVLLPGLHAGRT